MDRNSSLERAPMVLIRMATRITRSITKSNSKGVSKRIATRIPKGISASGEWRFGPAFKAWIAFPSAYPFILVGLFLLCLLMQSENLRASPGSFVSFPNSHAESSHENGLQSSLPVPFRAEAVRPEILDLAAEISSRGMVMESAVGVGGSTPGQYRVFYDMAQNATEAELRALLWHPSPVVRVYSYWALTRYKSVDDSLELLLQHADDWVYVPYMSGCIVSDHPVIELMAMEISHGLKQDLGAVFQLVVLRRAADLRTSAGREEKDSTRLRSQIEEGNLEALLSLASRKNDTDADFLLEHAASHDTRLFRLAAVFPHPSFFPMLEEISQKILEARYLDYSIRSYYFLAVAAYRSPAALDILEEPIDCLLFCSDEWPNDVSAHLSFAAASAMNRDGYYNELLLDYWHKKEFVNSLSFQQLCSSPSGHCRQMAEQALKQSLEPELIQAAQDYLKQQQ